MNQDKATVASGKMQTADLQIIQHAIYV